MNEVPERVNHIELSFTIVPGFFAVDLSTGIEKELDVSCVSCYKSLEHGNAVNLKTESGLEFCMGYVCDDCLGKHEDTDKEVVNPELVSHLMQHFSAQITLFNYQLMHYDFTGVNIKNPYYREPEQE